MTVKSAAACALVALLLITGCTEAPQPSLAEQRPFVVEVHEADFTLTWRIDAQRLSSADVPRLEATLVYTGQLPEIRALAGFSLVHFYLQQVDGPLKLEPVIESIGICHEVRRGEVVAVPYQKSGGFAEPGDPNFPVMNEFLEDPELHFPPGLWRITAVADFTLACGEGQAIHIEGPGEVVVTR